MLSEYGQRIHEYEALRGWGSSGDDFALYEQRMALVEQMADAFGPPSHVQVVGPYDGSLEQGADAFGQLCERLAALGINAALEYLPRMTNIPDARAAWELCSLTGRANAGLCVDSWHHDRSGESWDDLASVPGDRVFGVQFNDGPAEQIDPDYKVDCMSHRLLPGAGTFDLHGFVQTLDAMGVTAAYAIEVISLDLDRLPVDEAVGRMAAASRAALDSARS